MSYQFIKEKLDKNSIIILDGGNGGELEQIGAKMDKDLWAGKSAIDDPEKLFQVHEKYIKSGADVITSNTYAITPISMKEYGYGEFVDEWNKKTVDIALKAAASADREIAVAGSVSTSGSWDKLTKDERLEVEKLARLAFEADEFPSYEAALSEFLKAKI